MPWTQWRMISDPELWYPDVIHVDGPGCYELATAGRRRGGFKTVYIGKASDLRRRLSEHAEGSSHLGARIFDALQRGRCLWFRAWRTRAASDAEAMERRLLRGGRYPWNGQGGVAESSMPRPAGDAQSLPHLHDGGTS